MLGSQFQVYTAKAPRDRSGDKEVVERLLVSLSFHLPAAGMGLWLAADPDVLRKQRQENQDHRRRDGERDDKQKFKGPRVASEMHKEHHYRGALDNREKQQNRQQD